MQMFFVNFIFKNCFRNVLKFILKYCNNCYNLNSTMIHSFKKVKAVDNIIVNNIESCVNYLIIFYILTVCGELRLHEIWKNIRFSPAII